MKVNKIWGEYKEEFWVFIIITTLFYVAGGFNFDALNLGALLGFFISGMLCIMKNLDSRKTRNKK